MLHTTTVHICGSSNAGRPTCETVIIILSFLVELSFLKLGAYARYNCKQTDRQTQRDRRIAIMQCDSYDNDGRIIMD